jgi:LCP family protein required for cell wall assembly
MRTTLKRGVGRSLGADGNGNGAGAIALPPAPAGAVAVYRQGSTTSGGRLLLRILGWSGFVLAMVAVGLAGGAYLYVHESVAAVAPRSVTLKKAVAALDVPLPGQPATALVIGYDRRADEGKNAPSRSDTLMLVRADPGGKTISLLSLPRDLSVPIHCPGRQPYTAKINSAFVDCGERGALETVRAYTDTPINYIITVNFRGFRQLVDRLGGVWMDIDRRYFNDFGGPSGYAKIDLEPGYQRLTGLRALDFVRFRHTDSDLYRNARQQQFVRALKDQVESSFSLVKLPQVIKVVTSNVEVGQGGGKDVSARTVAQYAALAYSLPPGHIFQVRLDGLEGFADLTTAEENVRRAVAEFSNPDVDSPKKATAVALGEKVKQKVPPANRTSVTVLNGNGVTGSASSASYLLAQRSYQMVLPPNGVPANAPSFGFFRTVVFFDPRRDGAKPAATKLASLFGSADVKRMTVPIRQLANGAMLAAVVGQTFHGRLAQAPIDRTPDKQKAEVVPGTGAAIDELREAQRGTPFPLMVPTVVERSSWIDRERPVRVYHFDRKNAEHKTVRLTYRLGGRNEYWGVQQSDWDDAPVLGGKATVRTIKGRRYELHYNGAHLHMVVLRTPRGSYWVVNTLLDRLSNETMLAIAKGLKPIATIDR